MKVKIYKTCEAKQTGISLIEVIVCVAIFAVLSVSVYGVFESIIKGIVYYREKTIISSLADQYLEIARNMPYSQIGTVQGNPNGPLSDLPNPVTYVVNGTTYHIYYAISYVDDPSDGTISAGTDSAPNDYKQVKLYVKNVNTEAVSSFLTNISPKGLEGLANGGALSLKVFDAVGQPVPGATVRIRNTSIIPNVDLTRITDDSGNWVEVGLPNSANSYNITASKNGYSTDQTYPISEQNQNPTKPDATISNGQVTQISFSIDRLSNLFFYTLNQNCNPISGVGLSVQGSKLIGTPDVLKFDNYYTSDSYGKISLGNIEWDNYTPTLNSSNYMIYGSSPVQLATILPAVTQDFTFILGPKTTYSLLTIVKDESTGNPLQGAEVNLQSSPSPSSYTIMASAGLHGVITPSGSALVNSGANKTYNITADSGYAIENVSVDGSYVGAVPDYTFTNVTSDHAISAVFAPVVPWLSGWSYRKKITISNSNVGADLSNFPVLIKLANDADISSALSNGYDIRFTDYTGTGLLKYERENWSGGGGSPATANFWVRVPLVSHLAPTTIYIYYGNSSASTDWTAEGSPTNAQSVWDQNFLGVWHMADNNANKSVTDSTGINNGTAKANTNTKTTTGQIGRALVFNGSNDYIDLGGNVGNFALNSNFTIEAWANAALDSTNDVIYGNTWTDYGYRLSVNSSNKARFLLSRSSSKYNGIDSSVLGSGWRHIAGTWDTTAPKILIDGADNSQTPVAQGTVNSITTTENTKIGLDTLADGHYFNGLIDEVRVSDIVRSADWINFEYHNIADTLNGLNFYGQEIRPGAYTVTSTYGANGAITPSGPVSVYSGADQTFIIVPDYGYHISDVLVDGNSVGAASLYTFNNTTTDHTISATFDATVITGENIATGYTSGSVWSQQNWSGGSGQSDFSDLTKYYQDDGNISNNDIPSGLRLASMGNSYVLSGSLTSSTFDTGTNLTSYTILTWQPTSQNSATSIKFQIAANNDNTTWDYLGPDGTANTYYTVPGSTINNANGSRYVRYKVFLSTEDSSQTPVLTSVNINYVSGCSAPGQVIFPGLQYGRGYQATVSLNGYQTKTISNITIDGYGLLQVMLNH